MEFNNGEHPFSSLVATHASVAGFKRERDAKTLHEFFSKFIPDHQGDDTYLSVAPQEDGVNHTSLDDLSAAFEGLFLNLVPDNAAHQISLVLKNRLNGMPDKDISPQTYPFHFKKTMHQIEFTKDKATDTITGQIKDRIKENGTPVITDPNDPRFLDLLAGFNPANTYFINF
jgi:hypothetical protein